MSDVVTRHEFEAAMRRLETLLDKQTDILISLAAAETDNLHRDARISSAETKAKEAADAIVSLKIGWAKAAGAASVLVIVAEKLLSKAGVL